MSIICKSFIETSPLYYLLNTDYYQVTYAYTGRSSESLQVTLTHIFSQEHR